MMTKSTRALACICLAGTCLVAVNGCGSSKEPAPSPPASPASPAVSTRDDVSVTMTTAPNAVTRGRTGTPRGGAPTAVDETNADAVAKAVAQTVLRRDTALDSSPQDAVRRAARWMTADLAARQDASVSGGGAEWTRLAINNGWTSTTEQADPEPAPDLGSLHALRRIYVTVTEHGAGAGQSTAGVQTWAVQMELVRPSAKAPWRVSRLEMQPTP